VVERYVFLTAGACGPAASACTPPSTARPCATAGFDGFRVVLFQQKGGLKQATGEEAGWR
jgi:hypothetical protein